MRNMIDEWVLNFVLDWKCSDVDFYVLNRYIIVTTLIRLFSD